MSSDEWKEVRLGDICSDISYGYTASANSDSIGPKFLRITDIVPYFINWDEVPFCEISEKDKGKYSLDIGDIVIARTGATTGYNAAIRKDIDAVFASYLIRFKVNKQVADPFYVGYNLKTLQWKEFVNGIIGGSAQPGANAKALSTFTFNLPIMKVQNAIANLLFKLDAKIELNNQINKTLEEMAQAIFKRWFIDFEFPDENGLPYKSSGGEMVDSEMGQIPKAWNIYIFDDTLCARKEKVGDRNIPEYSTTNTGIFPRSKKFKKQLAKSSTNNKVIHKNDLVFGMSRQILNWGIMTDNIGAVSSAYDVFEVNQSIVPSEYLKLFMTHKITYFMDIIKPAAREGQGIDKSLLLSKLIYVPSKFKFDEFLKVFNSLNNTINFNLKELNNLINIRDSLLPKLMSGEIRVPIEEEVS